MSDRKQFEKDHPISPTDKYIVRFDDSVPPEEVSQALKDIFNKHGKGRTVCALPGGATLLITNIDWEIVQELKDDPRVSSIGPNRKAGIA